jgi:S1-C subfamily serine protease
MLKSAILTACLMFTACMSQPAVVAEAPQPKPIVSQFLERTVQVSTVCSDNVHTGTGVAVVSDPLANKSLVATAAHVVDGPDCTYKLLYIDGSEVDAVLWTVDPEHDVAVLLGTSPEGVRYDPVKFNENPELGEPVVCAGYPWDKRMHKTELAVTRGELATVYERGSPYPEDYRVTCPIQPGNSGGGVWSAVDGSLLGLTISAWVIYDISLEGHSYANSIEWLNDLLAPLTP